MRLPPIRPRLDQSGPITGSTAAHRSAGRELARMTLGVAFAVLAVAGAAYATGVRVNLSGSIPPGVYRIVHGPVERGTVVLVCLPPLTADFARSRGFIPRGSCADGSAPIGKTVAALPGDTVDVASDGIAVNGTHLRNSRPLSVDSENRLLQPFATGEYMVGNEEVWLVSSYSPRSFDSRYFGPVKTTRIVAQVRRLLR